MDEKDFFPSDIFNHNLYNNKSVQICLFDTAQQIFADSSTLPNDTFYTLLNCKVLQKTFVFLLKLLV